MASTKRKATSMPRRETSIKAKRVLSLISSKTYPHPSAKKQTLLSWSDEKDIDNLISLHIEKMKEDEVKRQAYNVVYYRDLESMFGSFGTPEYQEEFTSGAAEHGTKCHHCGEAGHWKRSCTLTCNKKNCFHKNHRRCSKGWHRGERIKQHGAKHVSQTYLQIALTDPEYIQWVMRQWEPALDIFDFQEWGKERNILYKKIHEYYDDLDHPQLIIPKKKVLPPLLLLKNGTKNMSKEKYLIYEVEFNTRLAASITALNEMTTRREEMGKTKNISESSTLKEIWTRNNEKKVVSSVVLLGPHGASVGASVGAGSAAADSPLFCRETL